MAVFNISVFSYGTILMQKSTGTAGKVHFKKMVNPGTLSAVLAILLYLLEVRLPDLILQPVASNVVMICSEMGKDVSYIAKGVFFSTVFSVITLPLVSVLIGMAG